MSDQSLPTLPEPMFFTNSHGHKLAYIQIKSTKITYIFLHGYMSDMYGDKSATIYDMAMENHFGYLALEYTGNGQSEGDFIQEGSIGRWAHDALEIIQEKVEGPIILVGSSMGGWLAFWLAKRLKKQVIAIIGIAAAPDFTSDLLPQAIGEEGLLIMEKESVIFEDNPWDEEHRIPWTYQLYLDGKDQRVMHENFEQPHIHVRLMQGMKDDVVPWSKAMDIAQWLEDNDVEIWISKDGDHRLSSDRDLKKLREIALELKTKSI